MNEYLDFAGERITNPIIIERLKDYERLEKADKELRSDIRAKILENLNLSTQLQTTVNIRKELSIGVDYEQKYYDYWKKFIILEGEHKKLKDKFDLQCRIYKSWFNDSNDVFYVHKFSGKYFWQSNYFVCFNKTKLYLADSKHQAEVVARLLNNTLNLKENETSQV